MKTSLLLSGLLHGINIPMWGFILLMVFTNDTTIKWFDNDWTTTTLASGYGFVWQQMPEEAEHTARPKDFK